MTLEQILNSYDFSPRFLAYFASQCAKEAMTTVKDPDPRSMLAIEVAERYGNGEDFDQGYLDKVRADAFAAASAFAATFAAACSAAAAYFAAASYAASYYSAAASRSAAQALGKDQDYFVPLLLRLIETRLTKLEQCLILRNPDESN